ncbi:S-adenosyl methyltransferase [Halopolyspora algeriensis]|uniref:S-adenosyl methyltransferase n=1 Tax=Halopolyspora algeriensis TaxID=1500506 RepID=A0A368VBF3_9ACTN|nr:SAM-dependent methyltransferase [Halopolyspora algeriensis]RCW38468.1 S-adenosyl methyltransferase [Halopolyspora algeriensis]TQM42651.1 S-adenosyl methyltransferase [Halopolyspora algeriensis]
MERPSWVSEDVDLTRPNAARVYDYYLGGFHNFAVDREMGERAIEMWPSLPTLIRANRDFLGRAVRFLAQSGIRQFLDLGSGVPTVGNVHEIARRTAPDSSVVYVDSDPVAVAHSRHLLADDERATIVQADLREPEQLLANPELDGLLDWNQPIALLMVAVLHFVPDSDDPAGLVARYRDALAPGSYLALSHASQDGHEQAAAEHQTLYSRTETPMTMRTRTEIAVLLDGFELVEPGLVHPPLWRPDRTGESAPGREEMAGYAAVGMIP